ncbi:hypothetical protein CEXT_676661 [Caerostris extrusa]|uniref:Uncharacterized protein n=1 Tax=Caerostris extrusa TaxID=172846 RepID=A0AAV4TWW2_CAEEX|nr:hypothetical protein CEXT_676661 [Caerostris extrusa]
MYSNQKHVWINSIIKVSSSQSLKAPSENPLTALVPDTIHFPILDADHARPFRGPCYSRTAIPVLRAVQFQTLGADGGTHGRKAVTVLLCLNGEELMGSRSSRNDGVVLTECIRLRRCLMIYVTWCPDYVFQTL